MKHLRISPREYPALLSTSVTFIPLQRRDKSHSIAIAGSGSLKQAQEMGERVNKEQDADESPDGRRTREHGGTKPCRPSIITKSPGSHTSSGSGAAARSVRPRWTGVRSEERRVGKGG